MKAGHILAVAIFSAVAARAAGKPAPPQSALPAATALAMRPVSGELTDKLDSKTAKAGDLVVVKTKSTMRLADGAEIPKGSKLLGHVTGVKPAGARDANSQIALTFDRIELKNGQSLTVQGEIQSLAPAGGESIGTSDPMAAAPSSAPAGRESGDMYGSTPSSLTPPAQVPRQTSQGSVVGSSANSGTGVVVARAGDLTIRATAIPGLLLANRESTAASANHDPGSPATQSSSILLGTQRDIHLASGTRVVLGVASMMPATPAGTN